jgi:SAM-dependent methyltransferase
MARPAPSGAIRSHRYLLGDSRREAARLRAQAALWDPVAHALFDRVGVREGWRVLEIGPGQGSLHLELRRRVKCPTDAVEPSPVFSRALRSLCRRDTYGLGRIHEVPLADAELPRDEYDFIFARWVFLFLPNAEEHLSILVRALKPGGVLALQDYHRETFTLVPRPAEWPNFVESDRRFFASQGSDASIGSRLPALFARAGLEVTSVTPTIKCGAPGSDTWRWLTDYFFSVMERYATIRPFTPEQAQRLSEQWRDAERCGTSLLIAPAVLDVVGRKARTL